MEPGQRSRSLALVTLVVGALAACRSAPTPAAPPPPTPATSTTDSIQERTPPPSAGGEAASATLDLSADGSLVLVLEESHGGRPAGASVATAVRIDRGMVDFGERLERLLVLAAADMPRRAVSWSDRGQPAGSVLVRAFGDVPAAHVLDVLQRCAHPECFLWNLSLETLVDEGTGAPGTALGGGRRIAVPTMPATRVEEDALAIELQVRAPGNPATGEVRRALTYALQPRRAGADAGHEPTSVEAPAAADLDALRGALDHERRTAPDAPVLLRVDGEATFGELFALLELLEQQECLPVAFGRVTS